MIKGFVFDLDGVITDTAKYHYAAWKQVAHDELGIDINPTVNEGLKGVSRMDSLNVILKFGGKENAYTDTEKLEYATEKNDLYKSLIKQMTPADILPGISNFLKAITKAGYPMSLASASRNAPYIIDRLGLAEYFSAIVDPATLTKGKPDPEIFEKAADLIHTPYANTVGLEDAVAGIEGIQAAGMFAVGVGKPEVLGKADLLFPDTAHLDLAKIEAAFTSQRG
ncbi:beta-phosphoglucomutase [Schleiferilactobacillus harbinensis]|jgi:beta-phosphoglucomutase|uniref:Beta-phosphoglucomutase n=1 Tax=Schleiferilactobacillus harbinensis TaxID=304207 RepID=A0A510TT71_9LACO|nr:beta-phosphoglucomutase [Schleiferilactobacillus harbinensis]HAY54162.1 beta-phosphoglucomutase [Lactobacillus sp.]MBO3092563.1 beta-phosphoglucomutase [Schleiferilactobacillus harbinensis]MCI1850335.1 beta-phosphoglucomutase [Schleiferilactobacillus harbinensis]QEU46934.1 beta-phosphoglucomutase [Schleiferilactobacillus harbinensis]QFR23977.1 beta-phosphoglucomutase [Schleiferilactobacillus harbinensis]